MRKEMMRRSAASTMPIMAYGFALIATACATVMSLFFPLFFAANPFTLFYLVAALAAWYGGLGAGLTGVFAGAIAADYVSLPSHGHFGFVATDTLPHMLVFIAVAGIITGLIAIARHRHGGAPVHHRKATDTGDQKEARYGERNVAERGLPLRMLDLRTHLTVATLAGEQLRRRHVSTITAARLCVYVMRAHAQMLDDIKALEAELDTDDQRRDLPP